MQAAVGVLESAETEELGGVAVQHRFATLPGGERMHIVEAGPRSGKPVLLLHGFPDLWLGWRHTLPALAAAGHRCVAVDLRGYGRSHRPSGVAAYASAPVVSDLVGVADALGLGAFAVVGHDWGACASPRTTPCARVLGPSSSGQLRASKKSMLTPHFLAPTQTLPGTWQPRTLSACPVSLF